MFYLHSGLDFLENSVEDSASSLQCKSLNAAKISGTLRDYKTYNDGHAGKLMSEKQKSQFYGLPNLETSKRTEASDLKKVHVGKTQYME